MTPLLEIKPGTDANGDNTPSAEPTLLLVDDEPNVLRSLKRVLRDEAYCIVTADSGYKGLEVINETPVHVVLSDNHMPDMDGISFLECVRALDPDIVRVILTGYASVDSAVKAINQSGVFEYLTKPWNDEDLKNTLRRCFSHYALVKENARLQHMTRIQNEQLRSLNKTLEMRVAQRTAQLEEAVREGILMLALAAEAKDDDTGNHLNRIRSLVSAMCLRFGLSPIRAEQVGFSSIMHDVGKIHVPDHILRKKGRLTADEMSIMRQHTLVGEKILGKTAFYETARRIARSHHERVDGKGYPDGLKGNAIPLEARIVCVADVFDALTHDRPYKKAWSKEKSLTWMGAKTGVYFDPEIFQAFADTIENP